MEGTTTIYDVFVNWTENSPTSLPCVAKKNWFAISFIPLNAIAILLNFIVLLASMMDKEKLQRQNYTLASVNSALLSHIVYLSLKIWGASANLGAKDSPEMLGMPKYMWTVCESGVTAIGFGVVANASSLIYVTIDSTFVAPRPGTTKGGLKNKAKSRLPFKRKMTVLLMVISWLVPMLFITIATLFWNCAEDCRCPSGAYHGEVCPHEFRCSRLVKPMTTGFLLLNIGLWLIELTALIILIIKKYFAFKNSTEPISNPGIPSNDENEIQSVGDEEIGSMDEPNKEQAKPDVVTVVPTTVRQKRVYLNHRFRFAVVLTALLLVCFIPSAVSILIDAFDPDANLHPAMIVRDICLFCYMFICPILVLKYLAHLRTSLIRLLHKLFCC